jgi:hypothetical protein
MEKPRFNPTQPFEVAQKPKFDPTKPFDHAPPVVEPNQEITPLDTAAEVAPNAFALGLGPFAAGVGGGAGAAVGTLESGGGLMDAYAAGKQGFSEARKQKNLDLKAAEEANPKTALASNVLGAIGSGIGTAGLLGGGLKGALATGAVSGGTKALSEAENPTEAAKDVGEGVAFGGLTHGVIKGAEKVAPIAGKIGNKVLSKTGEAFTGIPEKSIKTYIEKTKKINDMIKKSGGDIANLSDDVKGKIVKDISSTKGRLSQDIGNTLDQLGDDKTMPVGNLLDELNKSSGKLAIKIKANPQIGKDFDELFQMITNLSDENGNVSPKEMHVIKELFQDEAKSSYLKGGQMFSRGSEAQKAAKQVARLARQDINEAAPAIAKANNTLAELHSIESNLNRNVLNQGGSSAALKSIGSGTNKQQEKLLRRIGDITETNPVGAASDFSSASDFTSPGLIPIDSTGKAAARMAMGGLLGHHYGGEIGTVLGTAASSPALWKAGIQAKGLLGDYAIKPSKEVIELYLRSPEGQKQLRKGLMNE